MDNLEKAKEIANSYDGDECDSLDILTACIGMASWKDEQLDSAIDKALERNGEFLKVGKITQYGYDIAFATIQNVREYLKL